jgi:hypothetical protein
MERARAKMDIGVPVKDSASFDLAAYINYFETS